MTVSATEIRQKEGAKRWAARTPVVPDRTIVTAPAAREALDGILVAGRYDKRFGDLDAAAVSVLAALLQLYGNQGKAPSSQDVAAASGLSQHEIERLLADLKRHDLVILERDGGTIRGAYPFTEAATGHAVTFVSTGHTLNTMCVIDALGAGAMCREDAIVRSSCHACSAQIVVDTHDRGTRLGEVRPETAVVWTGFRPSCGCAADSLCTELVFFCCDEHLDRWRASGAASEGRRLSVEEAFQVGKALFADRALLDRD
jgi:hypothetical protein